MKKLIALLLLSVMLVGVFCGCGDQNKIDDLKTKLSGKIFAASYSTDNKKIIDYIRFNENSSCCQFAKIELSNDQTTVESISPATLDSIYCNSLEDSDLNYSAIIKIDSDIAHLTLQSRLLSLSKEDMSIHDTPDGITINCQNREYKELSPDEETALVQKISIYTAKCELEEKQKQVILDNLPNADETLSLFKSVYPELNSLPYYTVNNNGSFLIGGANHSMMYTQTVESNGNWKMCVTRSGDGLVVYKYTHGSKELLQYTHTKNISHSEYCNIIKLAFGNNISEDLIIPDFDTFSNMCKGSKGKGGIYPEYIFTAEKNGIIYNMEEYHRDVNSSKYYFKFSILKE